MNFTAFIKKVDQAANNMPAENLAAFLHDHALSIPEYRSAPNSVCTGSGTVSEKGTGRTGAGSLSEWDRAFHQELRKFGI